VDGPCHFYNPDVSDFGRPERYVKIPDISEQHKARKDWKILNINVCDNGFFDMLLNAEVNSYEEISQAQFELKAAELRQLIKSV
jgi:hypothetical protein